MITCNFFGLAEASERDLRQDLSWDSPDDSRTGVNIIAFPSSLEDRREVRTATGTRRVQHGRRTFCPLAANDFGWFIRVAIYTYVREPSFVTQRLVLVEDRPPQDRRLGKPITDTARAPPAARARRV